MEHSIQCASILIALLNQESLKWMGVRNYAKCKTATNCDKLLVDLHVVKGLLGTVNTWINALAYFMEVDISAERVRACSCVRGAGAPGMEERRRTVMAAYRQLILALMDTLPMLRVKQEQQEAFTEFARVKAEPVD